MYNNNSPHEVKVEIRSEHGRTKIYFDGKRLEGVLSFTLEHDPDKAVGPILTLKTRCTLLDVDLHDVILPLPAPWSMINDPELKDLSSKIYDPSKA